MMTQEEKAIMAYKKKKVDREWCSLRHMLGFAN